MSYVVLNVMDVPAELRAELESRFAGRAAQVGKVPGFEAFELLRPTDDSGRYIVYTRWASREAYEAWLASPAFAAGHRVHAERGPVASAVEPWSFEVIQAEYRGGGVL